MHSRKQKQKEYLANMDDFDLSPFFQTKTQATDFAKGLTHIIESLFHTDFQLENALLAEFGLKKRDAMLTFLQKHNIPTDNVTDLKDFFVKMQQYITIVPVLSLTIAFEPKEKTLEVIAQWFVSQLKKQILLEITVNPDIVAGATITYKGKFLDYSIKPLFEKTATDILAAPAQQQMSTLHQSTEHITLGR